MSTLQEDLTSINALEDMVVNNKVARFAYTEEAYNKDLVDGVVEYDVNKDQNIPVGTASVMKVNETVLNKGYRAQASSITRMLMNHFLGRISYNLNKVNDVVSSFIKTVKNNLGSANGIATLDGTGRIPFTQLPESAMEFMGTWDASTNTPTLTDGTGTNGSFYVVSVAGTQTFGGVAVSFNTNDRIIYDGKTSSWTKLSSGDVRAVNGKKPDATGNITLDAPDVNAVKTINNRSPQEGTGNINLESLSINGQSFNGSAPVSVDTMKMIYGGTGATEAKGAEFNITADMKEQTSDFTDTTKITCVQESPSVSTGRFFYSNASYLWNYIKGKISSVLGLTTTNYGGTALNATNAEQAARASTAGTADSAKDMYMQTFDLTSLDKTKFYPAFGFSGEDFAEVAIYSSSLLASAEYNQNRIHFDISTLGWSDTSPTLNIREYACYESNEITIGCIGRGLYGGAWAIWLRGGLTYTCFTRNCKLSLKTSDYAFGDEVYTVGTNYYGGANSNVEVIFTPQSTITEGAYSSRSFTAPVIQATTNFIGNLTGNATSATTANYAICSTSASVQDKEITLPGLTLTTGMTVNVYFSNGNSAEHPRLKVNSNDAIPIYTNKKGNLNFIVKDWDAGISMTLMFKGDSFVVLGNPIVKLELNLVTAGTGAMRNFIRYASGLLIQWGTVTVKGLTQQTIEAYTASSSYSLLATPSTPSDGATGFIECLRHDKKTIKLGIRASAVAGGDYRDGTVSWLTIGW